MSSRRVLPRVNGFTRRGLWLALPLVVVVVGSSPGADDPVPEATAAAPPPLPRSTANALTST